MILGWNEIKSRAFAFCKEWEGTEREKKRKQSHS